ncbi:hypothetical protein [Mycoplasmopsis bovis]|uniref:hypothetical protein n=1 Tax=Mycoplasmopsis bovis TaxID=28903 RepID=UPI001F485122|nr:hypothetical protein [Mycoplasmopsis bovis]
MSKKSRNNTIQYDNNDYSNIVDLHGFTIAEALTQVQLSLLMPMKVTFTMTM